MDKAIELLDETWFDFITYKEQKYIVEYKAMFKILNALNINIVRKENGKHEKR